MTRAHVRIDVVNYYPTSDSNAALRRFRAGELDTQTPMPLTQIDWLRRHMAASPAYQAVPWPLLHLDQPAPTAAHRCAPAACAQPGDRPRDDDANKVFRLGEPPAYGMVPPKVSRTIRTEPRSTFAPSPIPQRIVKAQRLMRQLGYGPDKPPPSRFRNVRRAEQQARRRRDPVDAEADLGRHRYRRGRRHGAWTQHATGQLRPRRRVLVRRLQRRQQLPRFAAQGQRQQLRRLQQPRL